MLGYFTNRVVFSIGLFFAALFVVLNGKWYLTILKDRYVASTVLLSAVVLISDVFHGGFSWQQTTFFNKLALLLLPLFIMLWKPKPKEVRWVHQTLYLFLLCNVVYSIFHYFTDKELVEEGYKFAKVMKVLSLDDHIRISWLTSIATMLALWDLSKEKKGAYKLSLVIFIAIQVIYLHVLSAKTGLLCLYLSFAIYGIYALLGKNKRVGIASLALVVLLPVIAFLTIPSFQNRIGYVRWDFGEFISGEGRSGLSDGNRFYSMQAGLSLYNDHKMQGVGFINLQKETNQWYLENMTFMSQSDYILPSSEFLIYAAGGGTIALLILLIHFMMPFTYFGVWKEWIFPSIYIPTLITFIYEIHFEGQFTLFVYGFFVFWVYCLSKTNSIK